ncbi:UNVERIFIED_CONTAM: hypothetical protein K2H54_054478 [Gekko kuhli]
MNLNETEKMISTVEHFHNQPYFWDQLYSLPWLQKGRLSRERGIPYLSDLLHTIQNSLAFLEDLNVMPSNQRPYSVLKLGLTVMTTVLEAWNGEGRAEPASGDQPAGGETGGTTGAASPTTRTTPHDNEASIKEAEVACLPRHVVRREAPPQEAPPPPPTPLRKPRGTCPTDPQRHAESEETAASEDTGAVGGPPPHTPFSQGTPLLLLCPRRALDSPHNFPCRTEPHARPAKRRRSSLQTCGPRQRDPTPDPMLHS